MPSDLRSAPARAARKTPGRSAAPRGRPRAGKGAKTAESFHPQQVGLGDTIRVERRFVLDGEMTCVADKGVFHGVQAMGSVEHILIETKGEVRLIPLTSVSEIVLEEAAPRSHTGPEPDPRAFDPSFA